MPWNMCATQKTCLQPVNVHQKPEETAVSVADLDSFMQKFDAGMLFEFVK